MRLEQYKVFAVIRCNIVQESRRGITLAIIKCLRILARFSRTRNTHIHIRALMIRSFYRVYLFLSLTQACARECTKILLKDDVLRQF